MTEVSVLDKNLNCLIIFVLFFFLFSFSFFILLLLRTLITRFHSILLNIQKFGLSFFQNDVLLAYFLFQFKYLRCSLGQTFFEFVVDGVDCFVDGFVCYFGAGSGGFEIVLSMGEGFCLINKDIDPPRKLL